MAFTCKIVPRPKVLHVLVEGDFELEEAKRHFLKIISALEEHGGKKVLFDGRGIDGDPAVVERFYYGDFVAEVVKQFRVRTDADENPPFAYVLFEPVLDPLRLGETVAINRGMNVKSFESIPAAVAWLELTPEDLAD